MQHIHRIPSGEKADWRLETGCRRNGRRGGEGLQPTANSLQPTRRRAFTFLELMLVVAILGILVALTAPRLVGKAKKAKIGATKTQMQSIVTALNLYEQDHGDFPTTEQGLEALVTRPTDVSEESWEKHLDKVPVDSWQQKFQYTFPGEHGGDFDLASSGPDKRFGTDDDITNYDKSSSSGK